MIEFGGYRGNVIQGQGRWIVVLPDWRGCTTDYAAKRGAQINAAFGCNVLVSDLFGVDYTPQTYQGDAEDWIARALSDRAALRQKLRRYLDAFRQETGADQVSVVGYCLGGALAFEAGRADAGLMSVASVHGIPSTNVPAAKGLSTRFIAVHGGSDPIIGLDHLNAFQAEMTSAGADWISIALGHAKHGFTNEDLDPNGAYQAYDNVAAERCLAALKLYL